MIVLLDADGRILAASDAWRATLAERGLRSPVGDVGEDYVEALTRLCPNLDPAWLRAQISNLAARRTDELNTRIAGGDGVPPCQLRIGHLDHEFRAVLLANHSDDSDIAEALGALHDMQDQLATARSAERQRFGESLARLTANHLDALRRDLALLRASLDGDSARELLGRMEDSLGEAMLETRSFAHLLHPAALDDGLAAAARRLTADFGADAGIALRYRASAAVDSAPREVQEAAFRIIQEALSNVHRHSGASAVSVTLTVRDGALHLRIADDGRGLGGAERALGVGIPGMQGRAAEFGGAVEVMGGRKGAIVLACLPMARPPAHGRPSATPAA